MIGKPGLDGLRAVRGVPVDHEVDLVVQVPDEPGKEAAHHGRVESFGEDHEVRPALGADRGHRVDREPAAGAAHDRSTALPAPGPPPSTGWIAP